MDHNDHLNLIKDGVADTQGTWADFGAGSGAFTLALAELLGTGGKIHSVDKNGRALKQQRKKLESRFPHTQVEYHIADYTQPINLPPLDGILMANALHFQREKEPHLKRLCSYLKPGGRFILVEYNSDHGNLWVPHPLSYASWEKLALRAGLVGTQRLATRPSRFLGQIYSALSFKLHR